MPEGRKVNGQIPKLSNGCEWMWMGRGRWDFGWTQLDWVVIDARGSSMVASRGGFTRQRFFAVFGGMEVLSSGE
jgi:hypothetical protein